MEKGSSVVSAGDIMIIKAGASRSVVRVRGDAMIIKDEEGWVSGQSPGHKDEEGWLSGQSRGDAGSIIKDGGVWPFPAGSNH